MEYRLAVDGIPAKIVLTKDTLAITREGTEESIKIQDVIGCEDLGVSCARRPRKIMRIWVIEKGTGNKLEKKCLEIAGDYMLQKNLRDDLTQKLAELPGRPKSLLVVVNPIAGNGKGKKDYKKNVSPILRLANIKCDVIITSRSKQTVEIAESYDLEKVDGVVLLGGDGTYHEFINVLLRKKQPQNGVNCNEPEEKMQPLDKPIAMIPSGTVNFVAETSTGCRCALTSTLHVIRGKTAMVNIIGVYADKRLVSYGGMGFTYGFITDVIYNADRKYRWLGRLRYVVVPVLMFFIKSDVRTYEADITCYTRVLQIEPSSASDSLNKDTESVMVEGRKITEFKSYSNSEVSFSGSYKNITCLNGNNMNDGKLSYNVINMLTRPRQVYSTILYKGFMTNMQIVRHFQNVDSRKEEESDDSFCHALNIRGMQIKVKTTEQKSKEESQSSDGENLEHFITVDGEIYEIKDLTIEQRLHQSIVPLFTDYIQD